MSRYWDIDKMKYDLFLFVGAHLVAYRPTLCSILLAGSENHNRVTKIKHGSFPLRGKHIAYCTFALVLKFLTPIYLSLMEWTYIKVNRENEQVAKGKQKINSSYVNIHKSLGSWILKKDFHVRECDVQCLRELE